MNAREMLRPRPPFRVGRVAPVLVALAIVALLVTSGGPLGKATNPALRVASQATLPAPAGPRPSPSNSTVWSLVSPNEGPMARSSPALAYDPLLNATVLFGGYSVSVYPFGDTWEFRSGTWTNISASLPIAPSARWEPVFVFDPQLGGLVLFGGRNVTSFFNDTWLFNASGWSELTGSTAPSPRSSSAVYDPQIDGLLMQGGFVRQYTGNLSYTMYNDTWEFVGNAWVNVTALVSGAPPPAASVLVWDNATGNALFYGGYTAGNASTSPSVAIQWTFSANTWTNDSAVGATGPGGPYGLYAFGATYDPTLGGEVTYGGLTGPDSASRTSDNATWLFANGVWSNLTGLLGPQTPPVLQALTMTYDAGDQEALMFGGNTYNSFNYWNETWVLGAPVPLVPLYSASFVEHGLPAEQNWTVTFGESLGTSSETTVAFLVPNGTYSYAIANRTVVGGVYVPTPASGQLVVAGLAVQVNVSFAYVASIYTVTVREQGLPTGTNWTVVLNGSSQTTSGTSVTFGLPDGSYALSARTTANYTANVSSPVVVHGGPVTSTVVFTPLPAPSVLVEFLAQGLSSTAAWSVTVTNEATGALSTGNGVGPSVELHLAPGQYVWSLQSPAGYSAQPSSGSLSVTASGVPPITVAFTPTASATPAYATLLVIDSALAIVILVGGLGATWGLIQYRNSRDRATVREWLDRFHRDAESGPSDPARRRGP
jgi:Galactose oxidase, central domain